MERHPGIVFRSGPAGRRAGLVGGPDIWEVVRAFIGADDGVEVTPEGISRRTGLTPEEVRTALRYYAEYPDEIGDWIRRVDEEADRAEASWRREQALLGR